MSILRTQTQSGSSYEINLVTGSVTRLGSTSLAFAARMVASVEPAHHAEGENGLLLGQDGQVYMLVPETTWAPLPGYRMMIGVGEFGGCIVTSPLTSVVAVADMELPAAA